MQAISQRVEELTRWLDEKAPNCATTQKHFDEAAWSRLQALRISVRFAGCAVEDPAVSPITCSVNRSTSSQAERVPDAVGRIEVMK